MDEKIYGITTLRRLLNMSESAVRRLMGEPTLCGRSKQNQCMMCWRKSDVIERIGIPENVIDDLETGDDRLLSVREVAGSMNRSRTYIYARGFTLEPVIRHDQICKYSRNQLVAYLEASGFYDREMAREMRRAKVADEEQI